jgi:hypothetical protein
LLSRSIDLRVIGDEDPVKLTAYLAEGDEVDIRAANTEAVCSLVSAAQQIPVKKPSFVPGDVEASDFL